jgi:hypothetical protein
MVMTRMISHPNIIIIIDAGVVVPIIQMTWGTIQHETLCLHEVTFGDGSSSSNNNHHRYFILPLTPGIEKWTRV